MKVFISVPTLHNDFFSKDLDSLKKIARSSKIDLQPANINTRFFLRFLKQNGFENELAFELELVDKNKGSILVNFIQDKIHYQRKSHRGKNELLAKALGIKLGFTKVLDLTAGLAQDAIFIRRLGFHVEACERNPWIYLMLAMAHKKALENQEHLDFFSNIRFHFCEGKFLLSSLEKDFDKTVVYIDPMYPEKYPQKKKNALPKKEMQIFRDLIGDDLDSEELLELTLKQGYRRVVVKRPLKAPPCLKLKPQHSFEGKAVRYDLYLGGK